MVEKTSDFEKGWELAFVPSLKDCGKSEILDMIERREWPSVWAGIRREVRAGGGCDSYPDLGVGLELH